MEGRAIVELLGKAALFGSLSEVDRAAIAGRMRRVRFEPDQMIFSRGDPARDLYLVLEGRIRISVLSSDGRELSFDHVGPGDIFGEIATSTAATGRPAPRRSRGWRRWRCRSAPCWS